jgi:hypothetical protein
MSHTALASSRNSLGGCIAGNISKDRNMSSMRSLSPRVEAKLQLEIERLSKSRDPVSPPL